jgi:hypothetical protein
MHFVDDCSPERLRSLWRMTSVNNSFIHESTAHQQPPKPVRNQTLDGASVSVTAERDNNKRGPRLDVIQIFLDNIRIKKSFDPSEGKFLQQSFPALPIYNNTTISTLIDPRLFLSSNHLQFTRWQLQSILNRFYFLIHSRMMFPNWLSQA